MLLKKTALAAAVSGALLAAAAPAMAADYTIDPSHTHIAFTISHLGFSHVLGYFGKFDGKFSFDPDHIDASKLAVNIEAGSIDTLFGQRNTDIKGADWLDVAEFPTITFVGTSYKKTDDKHGTITGDLTIHGVTKSETLDVTLNTVGIHPMAKVQAAGFDATATIKRSDFGIKTYLPYIGDDIAVQISVEAEVK